MSIKRKEIKREPSRPGEILKEIYLEAHNISQADFAKKLSKATKGRVKESTMKTKLSEVIKGKRAISADFAILVSHILKTNPKMWMNLQTTHDLWVAKQELDLVS